MQNVKNTMLDWLLGMLFPHLCCSCGAEGGLFCGNCKSYINSVSLGNCWVCDTTSSGQLCHDCQQSIDTFWVVGVRREGLQRLIGLYKFQYARAAADVLASLLAEIIPKNLEVSIVPIPTSQVSARVRGYDHMQLCAQRLGVTLRRSVTSLLSRGSHHIQHRLDRQQRQMMAQRSFYVNGMIDKSAHYLIVDDIVTTGATVLAAARALRKAGATRVSVAVIAKQVSTSSPTSVRMAKSEWRGDRVV